MRALAVRAAACRFESRPFPSPLLARWRVHSPRLTFSMPLRPTPAPDDPPQSSFAEILPCRTRTTRGRSTARDASSRSGVARAMPRGPRPRRDPVGAPRRRREATAELDAMSIAQSSPSYHRPWWAGGEYDEARAEVANDLGVASFRARDWSAAFDHHTEAIRLRTPPRRLPLNRAAAATNSVAIDAPSTTPTPPSSATRPTSKPSP